MRIGSAACGFRFSGPDQCLGAVWCAAPHPMAVALARLKMRPRNRRTCSRGKAPAHPTSPGNIFPTARVSQLPQALSQRRGKLIGGLAGPAGIEQSHALFERVHRGCGGLRKCFCQGLARRSRSCPWQYSSMRRQPENDGSCDGRHGSLIRKGLLLPALNHECRDRFRAVGKLRQAVKRPHDHLLRPSLLPL